VIYLITTGSAVPGRLLVQGALIMERRWQWCRSLRAGKSKVPDRGTGAGWSVLVAVAKQLQELPVHRRLPSSQNRVVGRQVDANS